MKKVKKIRLIFGTRPEAIKMAPLYHKLRADPAKFDVNAWVTAQHREILDQVLETFEIQPSVNLDLMKSNQGINDVTANVLLGLKPILEAQSLTCY